MHLRIPLLLSCVFLFGYTKALESTTGGTYWTHKDEIYIDDEGIEGSGGTSDREIKSDLESSGSGFGPDDEDGDGSGVDSGTSVILNGAAGTTTDKVVPRINNVPPVEQPPSIDGTGSGVDSSSENNAKSNHNNNEVLIMNPKPEDRATSFFAQPGILAAVIGGAVVGLLCAILVVMFIVYRMRKKDEGSYALDEPKRSPTVTSYAKGNQQEFYA